MQKLPEYQKKGQRTHKLAFMAVPVYHSLKTKQIIKVKFFQPL
jgi:hypothetical protein